MFESPRWLEPRNLSFHAHIKLDTDGAFYHPDLKGCLDLEPFIHALSFDRVTTCFFKDERWYSQSQEMDSEWYEVALKIVIWAVAWMLIVPGIVFLSIKLCYLEKVKEITKSSYISGLQEKLAVAKRENHQEKIFLLKTDIVAETIRDAASHERVVIKDKGSEFEVSTCSEIFMNYLPEAAVAYLAEEKWQEENRNTIEFFIQHFGEERTSRLFLMAGVDLTYYQEHGFALTRKDVANFLALTAFVHIDDMKIVHQEIQKRARLGGEAYLHLNTQKVQEIAAQLNGTEFDALDKQQYDLLWDVMTPLSISTMFVDKQATIMQTDQDRGCDLPSMIKALWIEQTHLRWRPDMKQRDFDYTLIKSLVGAFHENSQVSLKGKVVRQKKGYGMIHPMIAAAGCYCIPLEAMGATRRQIFTDKLNAEGKAKEDTYLSRLLFLPTQGFARFVPRTWESIAGVFQRNMGSKGVLAIWPRLQKLFEKPAFQKVDMIGYSQGGAQAALAATMALHNGNIRKLTKVCAPANDVATAELFQDIVRQRAGYTPEKQYAIKVNTIWQSADRAHMAEKREVSMNAIQEDARRKPLIKHKIHWYSTPKEVQERNGDMPHKLNAPTSPLQVIWEAFMAVWGAHGDDLTMDNEYIDTVISTVGNRNDVLSQLDNEPFQWEPVREEVIKWLGLHESSAEDHFARNARKLLKIS